MLNWFNVRFTGAVDPKDLGKYVMDSFLAHGKQLDTSAFEKARDTEALFRKFTTRKKPESGGEVLSSTVGNQAVAVNASTS